MESLRIGRKAGRNAVKLPTVVVCLVSTTGWAEWLEYSVFYKRNEHLQVLAAACIHSIPPLFGLLQVQWRWPSDRTSGKLSDYRAYLAIGPYRTT
jgi:hypothetical protein